MNLGRTTTLEIRTGEGVSFALPLASPIVRCLAWLIDLVVIGCLTIAVAVTLNLLASLLVWIPVLSRAILDFAGAIQVILGFVISVFYSIVLEWFWRGQTVGKRTLGLRVMDERGLSLSFRQIVLRNLFRIIDILPSAFYLTGGMSCLLTKRCQRLGDLAAGTLVIRRRNLEEPEIEQILSDEVNSFRSYPHLESRLRQRVTPDEARIALDALIRRGELESGRRLTVFEALANHFRGHIEFPEEAVIGLSDEQYVRNVVDTLFRKTVVL